MERQTFVTRIRTTIWQALLGSLLLVSTMAHGQGLAGVLNGSKGSPAASTAPDALGRDTPRGAIYGFLGASHSGNMNRAARYLDLSKIPASLQAGIGTERARQLSLILDRDPHFELEQLDNTPDGKPDDALASDVDRLATEEIDGRPAPLYLERVKRENALIWLVSSDSVQRIPELATSIEPSRLERWMPVPLVKAKWLGTAMWVWMALLLIAAILSMLSKLFSRLVLAVSEPLVKRYLSLTPTFRMQAFLEPLRLLLSVVVFRLSMEVIAPGALARDWILKVLALLFMIGAAALLMRIVDLVSDQWIARLNPREKAMSFSVVPLAVRFIKICILILAGLGLLREWGVDITAVLAGVGVGGLAVALAAQRTIENLFGGVSLISDRPVLVGDVCQFGGQIGTVEDIGLRSTRIRTNDRTLVTVPNSQFSTMTLENYSRRDRFWFHPTLLLRRDTPVDKIAEAMTLIEQILRDHPKVDPTSVPLRFSKIINEGFQLEIFSYVLTTDGDEFLRVQTELLLAVLHGLESAEVQLAVPFQESLTVMKEPAA